MSLVTPFFFRSPSIVSLLQEMDNMWDDVDANGPTGSAGANKSRRLVHPMPKMNCDVVETQDSFSIHADLPGVSKDKIDINIDKNVLTIQAVKEEKRETESETQHLRERSFGKVARSFQIPTNVLLDSSKCTFDNGALTISFAKNPALATNRKLQIQ